VEPKTSLWINRKTIGPFLRGFLLASEAESRPSYVSKEARLSDKSQRRGAAVKTPLTGSSQKIRTPGLFKLRENSENICEA
jgi:hypothetical protein